MGCDDDNDDDDDQDYYYEFNFIRFDQILFSSASRNEILAYFGLLNLICSIFISCRPGSFDDIPELLLMPLVY